MMRSMFSGVSGLRVHQTRMDVIGNNIANVNTAGYKSQRVTFSDVFSQTLSSATSANDDTGRGGVNAMQVGLGVNVSAIDMLMTQGAAQRTDNPFDLMINGDGFMVVADSTGRYFTRSGALRLDDEGNLVNPNGMKVQGWLATEGTNGEMEINSQEVQDINLFDGRYKSIEPDVTDSAKIIGNICSTSESEELSVSVYDSLGNYYTIPLILTPIATPSTPPSTTPSTPPSTTPSTGAVSAWKLSIKPKEGSTTVGEMKDAKGNLLEIDISKFSIQLDFDKDGKLVSDKSARIKMGNIRGLNGSSFGSKEAHADTGIEIGDVTVDLSSITQYATKSTVEGKNNNGNSAGTLSGYAIGKDGIINANYTNGEQRKIAQVVVANFDNPAGLEKVGDNLYTATTNSGEFDGIGDAGNFSTGVLEMSNVDLSAEFTDMIITQRGFQANSRIITVSDEMLQELTNLKR